MGDPTADLVSRREGAAARGLLLRPCYYGSREHSRDPELIAEHVDNVLQQTFPRWTEAHDSLETRRLLESLAKALMDPTTRGRYPITLKQ